MRLDELPGERKAEAERRPVGAARFGGAREAVEDSGLVRRSDPAAIVRDGDRRFLAVAGGVEQDPAAFPGIGDCVLEHIVERLAKARPVASDRARARLDLDHEIDGLLRRLLPEGVGRLGAELCEVDLVLGEKKAAAVALGQIEHVVDQRPQPGDGIEDRRHIFGRGRPELPGIAAGEHLREAADRGERRSKLIAHIGDEGGLEPVGLLERLGPLPKRRLDRSAGGDVEHGEKGIAVGERNGGELELAAVGEGDPAVALLALDCGASNELADQSGVGRVPQLPADMSRQGIDSGIAGELFLVKLPE